MVSLYILYKLSRRADEWACSHGQTYAHLEANQYEQVGRQAGLRILVSGARAAVRQRSDTQLIYMVPPRDGGTWVYNVSIPSRRGILKGFPAHAKTRKSADTTRHPAPTSYICWYRVLNRFVHWTFPSILFSFQVPFQFSKPLRLSLRPTSFVIRLASRFYKAFLFRRCLSSLL